jgi:molybdopterin synthase sulfur carrier subunit
MNLLSPTGKMKMQVNLYATFRLHAGIKSFQLALPPNASLRQAVQEIVLRYPVLQKDWLDVQGDLYAHVHIFVNGDEFMTLTEGIDTVLKSDSVLDFFPPVAGGC